MNFKYKSAQRGFTLIELIIVIVILGILTATALPKYIDLSDDAREASNKAVASSLATSIRGANIAWKIHGGGTAIADLPNYFDNSFNFNSFGYPIESGDKKTQGHDVITIPNANMCGRVWNSLLNHSVPLDESGLGDGGTWYYVINGGDYQVSGASSGVCEYTMMKDSNKFIRYNSITGEVTAESI